MALCTKGITFNKSILSPTVSFLPLLRIYKHAPSILLLKDPIKKMNNRPISLIDSNKSFTIGIRKIHPSESRLAPL